MCPFHLIFVAKDPLQLGVLFGSTRGHGGSLGAMVGHCYWSLLIILYVCNYCDGKNVLSSLQGGPPQVFGEPIRCVMCACTIESDAKDPCIQCQRVSVIIGTNFCPLCNAPRDSEQLLPSTIDHLHARELRGKHNLLSFTLS